MPQASSVQDRQNRYVLSAGGFRLMLFMFFLSGVAALAYQITWAKRLHLVFGVTLYAASAVVTAFMAGLALGSLYFGRWVDRWKRPLKLFAILQAGIAACAFLFPSVLVLLKRIYVLAYASFGDNHYGMSLIRFGLAFLVLLVPTSLMGGTLPVITRACAYRKDDLGRKVSTLYSLNNLGAFFGCLAAGFFFMEHFGPTGTMRLAALLNLIVMLSALLLDRHLPARGSVIREDNAAETPDTSESISLNVPVKVSLWVFAIEGVTSLIYQMAWIRMLVFFITTAVYSFSTIVSTYLVGLSLGAFLCRRRVDKLRNPYLLLGGIEMGIALSALVTIPLIPHLMSIREGLVRFNAGGLSVSLAMNAANFGVTFLVILVPTAFMGATLPVMSRIYLRAMPSVGRRMGVLGCLDTIGSVFGAFVGGFVLIPLLGATRTIIATALLNLVLAGSVFAVDPVTKRRMFQRKPLYAVAACFVAALMLLVVKPTPIIEHTGILKNQPMRRLVAYQEDQVASVSVLEQIGFGRFLYVNDECVGSTGSHDRLSHEIEIHQALLLHPNPKRLLIIGLGLGLGVGAALTHDVEVDAVELSSSVVRVNGAFKDSFIYYSTEHQGALPLTDPNVHVRIEDGRNYVLGTANKYDVIHVGGFHPLRSSSAAGFYTLEFFEDCKRILNPGGRFALWLPLHMVPYKDFQMILRTFHKAFPLGTVWHKHTADCLLLVGGVGPIEIDFEQYESNFNRPSVFEHLARSNVHEVYDMLDSFCLGPEAIARIAGEGPIHTDEHPLIEYHNFRVKPNDRLRSLAALVENREPVLPYLIDVAPDRLGGVHERLQTWFTASQALLEAQYLDESVAPPDRTAAAYQMAIRLNPDDQNARFLWHRWLAYYHLGLALQAFDSGRRDDCIRHLFQAFDTCPESSYGAEARFRLEMLRANMSEP